jgi:molecular chaperone GrpE (heat shock protein)
MTRQDRSQLDHIILEVIERGYHRGYELFRPAKVVVNDLSTPDLTDEPETLGL